MKKVAIYCRVDSGGDPTSLQYAAIMQRIRLVQFASANKYIISGYYEDIGYSSSDISRPGLLALNSDYDEGQFDAVLVVNRSRLYRGEVWCKPSWSFPILASDDIELQKR